MERTNTDDGMDSPVMSLEALYAATEADAAQRESLRAAAEAQLRAAIQEEEAYWTRLGSGALLHDAPDDTALSTVKEEFRQYARDWAKYGRDVSVIADFKAHQKLREERLDRAITRKQRKAAITKMKLDAMQRQQRTSLNTGVSSGGGRPAAPDLFVEQELPILLATDANETLLALDRAVDVALRQIDDGICDGLPSLEHKDRQKFLDAYDHMIETFLRSVPMKRKYGYTRSDHTAPKLKAGDNVPSYFANISDGSIYRRKVLSMAGLRNLIIYGPIIYAQLKDANFSGNLDDHKDDAGLKLMRRVTGNVVDLDTTVLRCTDAATLNAINSLNKHSKQPTHRNSAAFASSDQAQQIAKNCAEPILLEFARALKLSPAAAKARRVDPGAIVIPVPVASNNTDRGKWPVWQYVNAGQNSFHANVPTMSDVNGALLKAPYRCIRCWLVLHSLHSGPELEARVADFFENCVVDSCFNGKWKAIEEFTGKMAHEGTIVDVLQRAQMKNQSIFTVDFFDADDDEQTKEVAEMVRLTKGSVGREVKTGVLREITPEDVRTWVQDPSIVI